MSAYHHYLCFVVKNHFGRIVQQLVSALLTHGPLTLAALSQYSALPHPQARKALIICIQHNIIVAEFDKPPPPSTSPAPPSSPSPPPLRVLYRVHEAALRCRPRYPYYIQKTREKFSPDATLLIQALCLHGILTTSQLLDKAAVLYVEQQGQQMVGGVELSLPDDKREQLETALYELSRGRYVKRAFMAKVKEGGGGEEEKEFLSGAEMKKRKREEEKKEKEKKKAEETREGEKKTKGRPRKKPTTSEVEAQLEEEAKREEEEARKQREEGTAGLSDHWVVNDVTFTIETQRDALLSYVSSRISPSAAFVLSSLLRLHPLETARPPVYEEERLMEAVQDMAARHPNHPKITLTSLRSTLLELSSDPSHLLVSRGPSAYSLDFPSFLSHLQLLQTQSLLSSSLSILAARIFACLSFHPRLEESQLAEYCTASRQQVRQTLHEMMEGGWVKLYEVPRTVDRAPSKTFYLWGIERGGEGKGIGERVRELMWTAAVKVMEREGKEREEVKEIIQKVEMQQRIGEKERDRMEKWKIACERLELAQRRIEEMLAIWHD